jgi:Rrf2 family protein
MLRISKLTDYAILVMVELNESHGEVMNAHALADSTHLELPTVSKVLKLLSRAGLVQSFRGINGGYAMDREAGYQWWIRHGPGSRQCQRGRNHRRY